MHLSLPTDLTPIDSKSASLSNTNTNMKTTPVGSPSLNSKIHLIPRIK